MPYGITSTGFERKPLTVIEEEMRTKMRAKISPTLNLEEESALGQYVSSTATQASQVWEALEVAYAQRDPSQAVDDSQDTIGEIRGVARLPAAPSTALMTITLAAGTYTAGSLVVSRVGDSNARFANAEEITTAGATLTDQLFVCTENGPTSGPPNTLTDIANPVAGFSAPTNPAAATLGRLRETNDEYRIRQQEEQQVEGAASVNAIRADLYDPEKVPGVTHAAVYENDTSVYDPVYDLPPNSIGVVIRGGDQAVIARQIFLSKASGIQAVGDITEVVTTSSGQPINIGLSRPSEVPMIMEVTATVISEQWATAAAWEAAAQTMIDDAWELFQGVGRDVLYKRYEGELLDDERGNGVPGTINIDVKIDVQGGTPVNTDYVIAYDEIAILTAVTYTVNFVDAEP